MLDKIRELTSHPSFWIISAALLSLLTPNPVWGLLLGAGTALLAGNPVSDINGKISKKLLQLSVIFLGFGMNFSSIIEVGVTSVWVTMISISTAFAIGLGIGKALKIETDLSILLCTGTAVCGGSAIAAMSPSIGASQTNTAAAMAIVFLLNGIGLIIFPPVGRFLALSQEQFGFWAALAIHDTSSVVGAASVYGAQALAVGTTVKLTRALWILPLAFAGAKLNKSENRPPLQWFLVGFLLAAAAGSFLPALTPLWRAGAITGKHLMTGTLFLIGSGLDKNKLKKIGAAPLVMSVALWLAVSALSLAAVVYGYVPQLNI